MRVRMFTVAEAETKIQSGIAQWLNIIIISSKRDKKKNMSQEYRAIHPFYYT